MACKIVLTSAVDRHPDAVDSVPTVRRLTPVRTDELGGDHPDAVLVEMGRGGREEAGLEETVGVEEQYGVALRGCNAGVVGGGPGHAGVQSQMLGALLLCERGGVVARCVVDDDHFG